MKDVKGIFGFKETRETKFVNPTRQSIEQTEDYAVKKVINTSEGTIEKTPANNNDIVNKAYCDANGGGCEWTVTGSDIYYDTGYVGIGTATPGQPLEVISQSIGYMSSFRNFVAHGSGPVLRLYKGRGTYSSPLRARNGDTLGGVNVFGYYAANDVDTATVGTVSAQFFFKATEAHTSTGQGARFTMNITPTGSTTVGTAYDIYHDGTVLHFNLANLPTSSAGLNAGDIWVDTTAANVLKRV